MKTTRLFSFLILISLVSNANAQLRVLSNGRVQAGLLKDNNEDLGNVTSMQIYGRIGDARAGSKLTFGDFGQYANQGWNVFAGEYGTCRLYTSPIRMEWLVRYGEGDERV